MTVPLLRQALYMLSLEHVIVYIPCERSDVLFMKTEHLAQGNVKLSPLRYKMLKETYHKRMETMVEYATEEDVCRSRFLLEYFGQSETADCGKCDVCRKRLAAMRSGANAGASPEKPEDGPRDARSSADDMMMSREETADALREFTVKTCGGTYSLKQVNAVFSNPAMRYSPDFLNILRTLIDDGEVPPYEY